MTRAVRGRLWLAISGVIVGACLVEGALRACACAFLPLAIPSTAGWAPFPDNPSGHFAFRYNSRGDRTREPDVAHGGPSWCIVGDSHANGIGVDDSNRVSERLETRLARADPQVVVFNVASPGKTLPHYVAMIHRCRTVYAARTIIAIVHLGDDLLEVAEWIDYGRPDIALVRTTWGDRIKARLRASYVYDAVAFRWRQLQRRRTPPSEYGNRLQLDLQADFYRQHPERLRSDLAVFASQLHEMASAAGDTRLLVVTLPSWRQMDDPSSPNDASLQVELERTIVGEVKRAGLDYIDTTPILRADRSMRKYWPVERHLNDTGHALLADAIFQALVSALPPIAHDETREPR